MLRERLQDKDIVVAVLVTKFNGKNSDLFLKTRGKKNIFSLKKKLYIFIYIYII